MSDLVGNPKDMFSHDMAHILLGRSTGSSVRSDSPDLPETTLDILAYDSQILQRDLQEFTKRRRSSVYLRSLQNEMNKYFCDGRKTHLVDVTSPGTGVWVRDRVLILTQIQFLQHSTILYLEKFMNTHIYITQVLMKIALTV